ncbi:MAG: murB [Acidobacteria bacterium]|nr:murB [Acidobacteriota bacterium]
MAGELASRLGAGRVREGAPLAPHTTFRVGGPAEFLVEARDGSELVEAVRAARDLGLAVTLLGGGSNVLVPDEGIRGAVIRTHGGTIEPEGAGGVRADAGVTINGLVRWTIARGLGGLEAWAGTPGTVGGAVFGNAHFGGEGFGRLVRGARLLSVRGDVSEAPGAELRFAYDHSRLQETGEILVSVSLALEPGCDPARLRETARASLAHRKQTQPLHLPTAGCIFKNPDPASQPLPEGIPASAGALIDRVGLKGQAIGGARVSTTHANFIVNGGGATAADILALARLCRDVVRRRFGVELELEVRLLGGLRL